MTVSRMFPFINYPPWNPLGGYCHHECEYCWAEDWIIKYKLAKYDGPARLIEKELKRRFNPGEFVFVCDMLDLFGDWVPDELIEKILFVTRQFPQTNFLFLTKNPKRYYFLIGRGRGGNNVVLGATIESNRRFPDVSRAPLQEDRLQWMYRLRLDPYIGGGHALFISIEPILDFDLDFIRLITRVVPWAVAVGYDNYGHHLPEPSLEKTLDLIRQLEANHITVYRKTLREAWNESSVK